MRRRSYYPGYPGQPILAKGSESLDMTAPFEAFRFGMQRAAHVGGLVVGATVLLMDVPCGRPAQFVLAQDTVPADAPTCRECIALVEAALNWQGKEPRMTALDAIRRAAA